MLPYDRRKNRLTEPVLYSRDSEGKHFFKIDHVYGYEIGISAQATPRMALEEVCHELTPPNCKLTLIPLNVAAHTALSDLLGDLHKDENVLVQKRLRRIRDYNIVPFVGRTIEFRF